MRFRRHQLTESSPPAPIAAAPTTAARVLSRIIEGSSRVQRPAVRAYLDRLRSTRPGADPAEILTRLEKHYLRAVTGSGAMVGGLATVPAVGTLAAFTAITAETAVFLEATAFFALAVAELHDIPAEKREQRRALVLGVLVGGEGKQAVTDLLGAGRTGGAWLSASTLAMPMPTMAELNSRLMRYVAKRYVMRRGTLMFGKLLPMGIGAVVGAVGNRLIGKKIVKNARAAFGPPPDRWPVPLHLIVDAG